MWHIAFELTHQITALLLQIQVFRLVICSGESEHISDKNERTLQSDAAITV